MIDLWIPPKPAIIRPAQEIKRASFLPGQFPPPVMAFAAPTLVYVTQATNSADQSSYTFSSTSLGAAKITRTIVLAVNVRETLLADAITATVTIAGVSAAQQSTSTSTVVGGRTSSFIFSAKVPSETTGNVVVTLNRTVSRCGIGVWAVYDLKSNTATASASSTSLGVQTLSVNVQPGGVVVGTSFANVNPTFTWSGLTEDYETVVEGDLEHSGASVVSRAGATPLAVTCTVATPTLATACSAAFR